MVRTITLLLSPAMHKYAFSSREDLAYRGPRYLRNTSDLVTDKYSISFLLYEVRCDGRRTIASTLASLRWVLYIIAISQPEQAPGEQEKATGTRDRREIYMKIERRIVRCVLHKIDVSRITRGDIFILRHVSVSARARARSTEPSLP